jgi:hypothetical protein
LAGDAPAGAIIEMQHREIAELLWSRPPAHQIDKPDRPA